MNRMNNYRTDVWIDWCPGCGDYGIVSAMTQAFSELDLDPTKTVIVSGIGCSGKTPHFIQVNGVHSLHGRAIPFAMGIKLANPKLTVIVNGGDGDLLGIGAGHFVALGRRNIDLTVIVHNNQVYGLTKGQASPTLPLGVKTKALPKPNIQNNVDPIVLALSSGYTFVARSYAMDIRHLKDVIKKAIRHKGAALIDVLQPCVTYNDIYDLKFYRKTLYRLEDEGWDPYVSSPERDKEKRIEAIRRALDSESRIPIGVFLVNPYVETFEDRVSKQIPEYSKISPSEQVISLPDGRPIITTSLLKKLFKDLVVEVKESTSLD